MPQGDYFVLIGVGGGFLILGLVGILWGKREETDYFESMASRRDLREFVSHWPPRPQPGAVKIGGWIAVAIGLLILATGITLWILD